MPQGNANQSAFRFAAEPKPQLVAQNNPSAQKLVRFYGQYGKSKS
jgi:hypothetical protein